MNYPNAIFISLIIVMFFILSDTAPTDEESDVRFRNKPTCDCVCGRSNRQMKIIGGNETKPHEFPWIAGLSRQGKFECGGSLITKRHILTAAHCVNGFDIRDFSVFLADHNRESSDRLSKIIVRGLRRINQHELFNRQSYNNDIAILELDSPVDFTTTVQPACLPQRIRDYSGSDAVAAGWGFTGENEITSHTLQKVTLPVWTTQQCHNSHYGQRKISENMFCAGYSKGERDTCQGDSGGPLHVKNIENGVMEIIGLVSWGRGCARPNLPGVYTRVTNYLDWVNKALDGECLCHPLNS